MGLLKSDISVFCFVISFHETPPPHNFIYCNYPATPTTHTQTTKTTYTHEPLTYTCHLQTQTTHNQTTYTRKPLTNQNHLFSKS